MKKLLVTAIGAAAAFGAVADTISTQRFKEVTSGSVPKESIATILDSAATPSGTYWSDPEGITNEYKVSAVDIGSCNGTIDALPGKALEIKTTFGNPLSVNVVSGGTATNIPNSGIYFDSLVKFTVCEDEPDQEYSGAKIVMWLQEVQNANNDPIGTNLMVRAGYLTYSGGVSVVPTNYVCGTEIDPDFADKWHRVTIKAMADITTDTGVGDVKVPGFAIFLDGNTEEGTATGVASDDPKWNAAFESAFSLSEAAGDLGQVKLFPSIIQDDNVSAKMTITQAGFDGTGSITDIVFTDKAPDFAKDYVAPKAYVKIGDGPGDGDRYDTLAEAIAAVNEVASGNNVRLTLAKGMELAEPIEFTTAANVVLDFGGFVLTNTAAACAITNFYAAITVVDSGNGGGIRCTTEGNDVGAFYNDGNGSITIAGGNYWAKSVLGDDMNISVTGGKFDRITWGETDMRNWIDPNKKFVGPVDGLYSLDDREYYTVTFMNGEAQFATTNVLENTVVVAPSPAPTKAGHTFAYWYTSDEAVEYNFTTPVTGALTLNAKFTANTYTITFTYGLDHSSSVTADYAYGATPTAPNVAIAVAGYNAAWPAFSAVTEATTYAAVYTGKTFTIKTYTNGVENTSKEFTYAGASVNPADPLFNSETETWDGKWYTENGGSTEFAFDAAGELTQNAYATIESKGGSVPDIPAGGETDCGTAEAATAAAAAINADAASKAAHIAKPSTVGEGDAATTYYSYVEAKAVGTKVTVDFSDAGTTAAQTSANTDVVALPVAAAAAGNTTADVSSVAGFYYSIVSGATPSTVTTEGTRVLGTGGTITLALPKVGTAGFYKVKVSATAK